MTDVDTKSLLLVLLAAGIHATWNFLSKRTGGGATFIWLVATITTVMYAPLIVWLVLSRGATCTGDQWWFLLASGLLHLVYFLILQRGYLMADFSLVYPVARGTGPALSVLGGVFLLGEHLRPAGWVGAALMVAGIFLISGGHAVARDDRLRLGVGYGLATGACIAGYSVLDKFAVARAAVHPILLDYAAAVTRSFALAPVAWRQRAELARLWRDFRGTVLLVALLNPISFIIVLYVMRHTPVSVVAPAREISILLGVFLGAHVLQEGQLRRRLFAAAMMFGGLVLLALN
jgi:drug/metabolite transporter (DMT)-like permease